MQQEPLKTQQRCHTFGFLGYLPLPAVTISVLTVLRQFFTWLINTCVFHFPLPASPATGIGLVLHMLNSVLLSLEDVELGHQQVGG